MTKNEQNFDTMSKEDAKTSGTMPRKLERYPLTLRIEGDTLIISQETLKISMKSYRISELMTPHALGLAIFETWVRVSDAPECPRIDEKVRSTSRLAVSPDYWTVTEFSALHGISEATVKRMCIRGELEARKIASRWRISGKPHI